MEVKSLVPFSATLKPRTADPVHSRGIRHGLPELRFDRRSPLRIAVAISDDLQPGVRGILEELRGNLPSGSWIHSLRGTVNRGRVEDLGVSWRNAAELESWFSQSQPDLLFYPRIEDIEFGLQPMGWQQSLRISLPHVLVHVAGVPSTVRERLLAKEMMMAVGDFWPGAPDGRSSPLGSRVPEGLSWVVQGSFEAAELMKLRPRRAVKPRIQVIQDPFNAIERPTSPSGLIQLLLGGSPLPAMVS